MAAVEKEKGNIAFKAGKFAEAVGHYSAAIFLDRSDPTLPLNRAAAYLKLGKNEDAERDCSTVLGLPSGKNNVKALFRRYQARMALGKKGDAERGVGLTGVGPDRDLREALKIEPQNEAVKKELQQFRSSVEAPVSASNTPASPSSKPYRRRVPIAIVEGPESSSLSSPAPPKSLSGPAGKVPNATESPSLMSAVSSRSIKDSEAAGPSSSTSTPKTSASSNSRTEPRDPKFETREINGHKVGGGIFRSSLQAPPESLSAQDTSPTPQIQPSSTTNVPAEPNPAAPLSEPSSLSRSQVNPPTKAPANLYDFIRAWNAASSADGKWKLINLVPPEQLPKLFLTALEPGLAMDMVRTFNDVLSSSAPHGQQSGGPPLSPDAEPPADESAQDIVRRYMKSLTTVPRFEFVRLFLSDKEKEVVRNVARQVPETATLTALWGV
ncbi:hypothetical protein FS837_008712 [Tulasnella sp. UAMH 9824]|nr:hypothetical protein FS837_008712 [Tulasnella sp. UAMH 9824]